MDELIKAVEEIIKCPVPDDVVEQFRRQLPILFVAIVITLFDVVPLI